MDQSLWWGQSKLPFKKFALLKSINCMLCKFTSSSSVSSYLKLGCRPKYHAVCTACSFWGWLVMEMLLNPISNFGFKWQEPKWLLEVWHQLFYDGCWYNNEFLDLCRSLMNQRCGIILHAMVFYTCSGFLDNIISLDESKVWTNSLCYYSLLHVFRIFR